MATCRYLMRAKIETCGKEIFRDQDSLPEELRGYCALHKYKVAHGTCNFPCELCGKGCKSKKYSVCKKCGGRKEVYRKGAIYPKRLRGGQPRAEPKILRQTCKHDNNFVCIKCIDDKLVPLVH